MNKSLVHMNERLFRSRPDPIGGHINEAMTMTVRDQRYLGTLRQRLSRHTWNIFFAHGNHSNCSHRKNTTQLGTRFPLYCTHEVGQSTQIPRRQTASNPPPSTARPMKARSGERTNTTNLDKAVLPRGDELLPIRYPFNRRYAVIPIMGFIEDTSSPGYLCSPCWEMPPSCSVPVDCNSLVRPWS